MDVRRGALIAGAVVGGGAAAVSAWTALASWAYAYIAQVPRACWFYYAWPLPDRFLWDGLDLILSGFMGAVPFILAGRIYLARRQAGSPVYGKTEWASRKQMQANRITTGQRPF